KSVLELSLINAGFVANLAEADALITDPVNGFGFSPDWDKTNTNWYDLVTHQGSQQQYNLSMTGGSDKTQFYISGGYFKQIGTTLATDFERYNSSISITHKANDKLTITAILNASSTKPST